MTKYRIPATNGKPTIEVPELVDKDKKGKKIPLVKSWSIYANCIVIETTKEIEELKDYKI